VPGNQIWLLRGDESLELIASGRSQPSTPGRKIQKPGEGIRQATFRMMASGSDADPEDSRLVNAAPLTPKAESPRRLVRSDSRSRRAGRVVEAINKTGGHAVRLTTIYSALQCDRDRFHALHNAAACCCRAQSGNLESWSPSATKSLRRSTERHLQPSLTRRRPSFPTARGNCPGTARPIKLSAVTGLTPSKRRRPEIAPLTAFCSGRRWPKNRPTCGSTATKSTVTGEDTRAASSDQYFADSGMRGFYAMPLTHDSGRV